MDAALVYKIIVLHYLFHWLQCKELHIFNFITLVNIGSLPGGAHMVKRCTKGKIGNAELAMNEFQNAVQQTIYR